MDHSFKFKVFQNDNSIDLTLYQFGWERCLPMHSFGPAKRNHYLFHFVFSGSGTLMTTDTSELTHTYHLDVHQGFLICPGQVTTYYADERHPWEYAWLEFDGVKAPQFLDKAGISYDHPIYQLKNREQSHQIETEIMHIVDNPDNSSISQIGHLYLFFDRLIQCSANRKENRNGSLREFYIHEAISFIEQNYHFPITVESIASFCGLNRSYLGKIFREEMQQTPQHFLMNYRMSQAAELLKTTGMSIYEVGCRCGYQNQLHFSRAFKNIYQVSPSRWREQQAGNASKEK